MSSSSNVVNFSLRQNKAIERSIVFDGIQDVYRMLSARELSTQDLVYIGFGSVWFTDFQLAHRQLGVNDMISIEEDDVTFKRAIFNRPFKTVDIVRGRSDEVLSDIVRRDTLVGRPTIVWLDYDKTLDREKLYELIGLAEALPNDSFLLTTFGVRTSLYAKPRNLTGSLKDLFGDSYEEYGLDVLVQRQFANAVGRNLERQLLSTVSRSGRESRGLPAFFLPYRDGTPMLTVGIFIPSAASCDSAAAIFSSQSWKGRTFEEIATPPLTSREVEALQAALPAVPELTRNQVQEVGFDLEEDGLASFSKYYTRYPSFVQIAH